MHYYKLHAQTLFLVSCMSSFGNGQCNLALGTMSVRHHEAYSSRQLAVGVMHDTCLLMNINQKTAGRDDSLFPPNHQWWQLTTMTLRHPQHARAGVTVTSHAFSP